MEEIKNGVISEEALEEIAGGLKMPKLNLKNVLAAAGVVVGALGTLGATTVTGYEIYKHKKNKKDSDKSEVKVEEEYILPPDQWQ